MAIDEKKSSGSVFQRIESKLEEAIRIAEKWGTEYENSLKSL